MNNREGIKHALDRIDGIIVFAREAQKTLVTTTPLYDANIRFEILAKAFLRDTGMMAPGKDIPPAMNPDYNEADRLKAWRKWLKENDVPEPTPQTGLTTDALVEAVKDTINTLRLTGHDGNCGPALCSHCETVKVLNDALAAHEKAGA